jgi:hypothetical protein
MAATALEDQGYDPDEPWDGLFRCKLLVLMSFFCFIHCVMTHTYFGVPVNRHINISSHPQVHWQFHQERSEGNSIVITASHCCCHYESHLWDSLFYNNGF